MPQVFTLSFAHDHVSAIGHFPGNPIIPGAVLLSDVVAAICDAQRVPVMSFGVSSAKFLHPVRPGDIVAVSWQKRSNTEIHFDCLLDGTDTMVLTGALTGHLKSGGLPA